MSSFAIKPAYLEDIPAIIAIQEKTWEPTYRDILSRDQIDFMFEKIYSKESLTEQMLQGHQFLVLETLDKPEGFSAVSDYGNGIFKLHKIYVLPSTQGSGAGKFLLHETEQFSKSQGASVMRLNVNRYNRAKGFYEKMGYQIIGEEDIAIGPYWMNDFILEKSL